MPDSGVVLPNPAEAPRCAPWTRDQRISPAGTAIRADRILLLDVPGPWPKPIRDHPRLLGMMDVAGSAPVTTRLLASLPVDDRIRLTVFTRRADLGLRSTYVIDSEAAIPDAIAAACGETTTAAMRLVEPSAIRRSVLVCTQGTHDICCGSDGVRLSGDIERNVPGVDVYRISHTGGHRFAPTALTMPDGRMWAWLTVDDIRQVFDRSGEHRDLARRCRGWWGAEQGAQQAAEVAVFERFGWTARPTGVSGDSSPHVVQLADRALEVGVEAIRTVPTISCRSPGGVPAKEATEYAATTISRGTPSR